MPWGSYAGGYFDDGGILRMKAVRRCLSQTGFLSILAFHQKFMSPRSDSGEWRKASLTNLMLVWQFCADTSDDSDGGVGDDNEHNDDDDDDDASDDDKRGKRQ